MDRPYSTQFTVDKRMSWRDVLFCGGPLEGEVLTIGAHLDCYRAWNETDEIIGTMAPEPKYEYEFVPLSLSITTYDITVMEVAPGLDMNVGVIPGHPVNHALPMILNLCALMAAPGGLRKPR